MARRRFCAKCGKAGDYDSNICPDCTVAEEKAEKIKVWDVCRKCGRWRDGKRWKSHGMPKGKTHEVVCPLCLRGPEYVAAKIQLRSRYIDDYIEEALDIIASVVKAERKKGRHVNVRRVGNDVEFSSQTVATKSAAALEKHFGIKLERTGKLVTFNHEKGKEVIRSTIMMKLPEVKAGDTVRLKKLYTVVKVGALVILEDEKGERRKITHQELKNAKFR